MSCIQTNDMIESKLEDEENRVGLPQMDCLFQPKINGDCSVKRLSIHQNNELAQHFVSIINNKESAGENLLVSEGYSRCLLWSYKPRCTSKLNLKQHALDLVSKMLEMTTVVQPLTPDECFASVTEYERYLMRLQVISGDRLKVADHKERLQYFNKLPEQLIINTGSVLSGVALAVFNLKGTIDDLNDHFSNPSDNYNKARDVVNFVLTAFGIYLALMAWFEKIVSVVRTSPVRKVDLKEAKKIVHLGSYLPKSIECKSPGDNFDIISTFDNGTMGLYTNMPLNNEFSAVEGPFTQTKDGFQWDIAKCQMNIPEVTCQLRSKGHELEVQDPKNVEVSLLLVRVNQRANLSSEEPTIDMCHFGASWEDWRSIMDQIDPDSYLDQPITSRLYSDMPSDGQYTQLINSAKEQSTMFTRWVHQTARPYRAVLNAFM